MTLLHGKSLSPGLAQGKAYVLKRIRDVWQERSINCKEVPQELVRFEEALLRSTEELDKLKDRICEELGQAESGIFEAHLGMLNDAGFVERCRNRVRDELMCIETAIDKEISDLEQLLADVESELIRERTRDLQDIRRRLLKHLRSGATTSLSRIPKNSVIVAHEVLPSHTIELDRTNVVAIVTECGGAAAHSTILARALGIPLITGVANILRQIRDGEPLLVDAISGKVTINPSKRQRKAFQACSIKYQQVSDEAHTGEASECLTKDGTRITFLANIGNRQDTSKVEEHNLSGVGLLRTECLFLNQSRPPTLRQHIAHYEFLATQLSNRPAVIRTLDLGGDKVPFFLNANGEKNPIMGMRGLRYSLVEKRMFRTQLKAIVRCWHTGANLSVLFPMVLGAGDLDKAIEILDEVLEQEGCSCRLPLGAMIETPSAVFQIEEIIDAVDFVTIGTNDLTQFILAADRESTDMLGEYSVLHPSVLKAVQRITETCRQANKPCTICGEAAGDPATAALFVGMGLTRLSMSPVRAGRVQSLLKELSHKDLAECARQALQARTTSDVEQVLTNVTTPAIHKQGLIEARYEFIEELSP